MADDAPSPLAGLRIVLGVSGGIAAYKAAALLRLLRKAEAEVVVTMTEAATHFIGPLTMATLSGKPVITSLWERVADESLPSDVEHIGLVKWADLAVLAPATMNTLAELARGLADDPVTTFFGAYPAERSLLAPAMNGGMWRNPATRKNVRLLRARGYTVTGPGRGELACGDEDEGRMAEPEQIVNALAGLVKRGPLAGRRVLVTAGPTREWIDAVRFWSNASTGTMGLATAEAARALGARVTLIAGPGVAAAHPAIRRVDVESAADMASAVYAAAAEAELTVMAAAVADWRSAAPAAGKLKKQAGPPALALEATEDILAGLAARGLGGHRVGFALETERLEENARAKLAAKGLALIVANAVGEGAGFGTGDNTVLVLGADGFRREFPRMDKRTLGRELVALIAARAGWIRAEGAEAGHR
jgi:phosphopantothenoylcysteine decarboxylase/phosphopantothenate--cysteine ligase